MSIREDNSLQVRHAFPAYRIFIFGVEVTEDVFDVNIQYNVGRAPNTCTITLGNEFDKYILTTNDFKNIFNVGAEAIALGFDVEREEFELGGTDIINKIDKEILNKVNEIQEEIKRDILKAKVNIRIKNVEQPDIAGKFGGINVRQYTADASRYPFQAEDPIFHANDPIRVFWRDPYDPRKWYHMFSGFLSDFDDSVDENLQKTLTITAEGPSKILRYARVTTNPGIIDAQAIVQSEVDASFRSAYSEGFSGLTLPELFFILLFGNSPDIDDGTRFKLSTTSKFGTKVRQTKFKSVGNFNFSNSIMLEFGPESTEEVPFIYQNIATGKVNSLSVYQSIIDHEVKETDLIEMVLDTDEARFAVEGDKPNFPKNSNGNITTESIIEYIGTRTELYPIDGGRLIMLLPKSLHPEINREVLLRDVLRSFALNTEFKSRLGIIYDVVDRLEFIFYESPKGDLICEFPLYDFDPDDFGTEEIPHYSTSNGFISKVDNISRGPFGSRYIITKRDTYNFSKGMSDEKIRTQIVAPWHYLQNYTEVGTSREVQKPSVVTLRHLVPLYWLRLEQVDPKGYIASNEAALLYAQILLNKTNADARNLGINTVPNLGLWINRPIFFTPRRCIGILMSLGHDITWGMGGSMNTRLNMNYIRGWDGLLDNEGKIVYTPIGGQPSRPLDYKLLFKLKDINKGAERPPSDTSEQGDFNILGNTGGIIT
jgi:hypothetical protein